MIRTRVIPCLLLRNRGLVKTVKFKDPKYLGDPINIIRIFNEKEVDELLLLDTTATIENRSPPFDLLAQITDECFMPLGYGGGIRSLEDMKTLFHLGVEKIAINSYALENPLFIEEAAGLFGSQSIVVSIDAKRNRSGQYEVFVHAGQKGTDFDPVRHAVEMEKLGAGELFLNSIDRDGTMQGYDLELIRLVSKAVRIPVVACGGAGKVQDFVQAVKLGGASAVAAGSLFVFQGPHRAVLISYPDTQKIQDIFRLE
jgi:cyclase